MSSHPIIILGMHRSGTSLVTRVLEDLGLFVGSRVQGDHEATFFLKLNDWLLRQAGVTWDRPQGFEALLEDTEALEVVTDYLRLRLRSPQAIEYLGSRRLLHRGSVANLAGHWGWKDPRNTYTLPIWTRLFPEARILHIHRNGVDVAHSLVKREAKLREVARETLQRRKALYRVRPRMPELVSSVACASYDQAFELWKSYYDTAETNAHASGLPALTLKYEAFLADPVATARELVDFCALDASPPRIERAVARANPTRAYAYRNDARLSAFATRWAKALEARGYDVTDA